MRVFVIAVALVLTPILFSGSALADYCSICVTDYCETTYRTDNDGDGVKDDFEIDLAKQFKPVLYLIKG